MLLPCHRGDEKSSLCPLSTLRETSGIRRQVSGASSIEIAFALVSARTGFVTRDLEIEYDNYGQNCDLVRCTAFYTFRRVRLYHQPANFTFGHVAEEGREEMNVEECAR